MKHTMAAVIMCSVFYTTAAFAGCINPFPGPCHGGQHHWETKAIIAGAAKLGTVHTKAYDGPAYAQMWTRY